MFMCDLKLAKDSNNISDTVRYGLGGKAQLVGNLPCMQICVIWAQAQNKGSRPKHETKQG